MLGLILLSSVLLFSGCATNGNVSSFDTVSETNEEEVYRIYQENGGTMTYEEWTSFIKGDKGDTGFNGTDGTALSNGTKTPEETLGKDGDSYIDTALWDYYVKSNGTWIKEGNIKGTSGENGNTHQLRINEETNEWEVSYDNGTTWTGLNVKATGTQGNTGASGDKGDKGDNGLSAYEIYVKYHPEYTKSGFCMQSASERISCSFTKFVLWISTGSMHGYDFFQRYFISVQKIG